MLPIQAGRMRLAHFFMKYIFFGLIKGLLKDYSTEEDDGPAGGKAVDGDDEGEEGEEDDGEGRGSGGRSQLPVRTTLVATGEAFAI